MAPDNHATTKFSLFVTQRLWTPNWPRVLLSQPLECWTTGVHCRAWFKRPVLIKLKSNSQTLKLKRETGLHCHFKSRYIWFKCCFWDLLPCTSNCPQACLPPEFWSYRHALPCLAEWVFNPPSSLPCALFTSMMVQRKLKDGDGAGQVLPGQASPPATGRPCQLQNVGWKDGRVCVNEWSQWGVVLRWKSRSDSLTSKEAADCVQIPGPGRECPFGLFFGPGHKGWENVGVVRTFPGRHIQAPTHTK